MSEFHRRNEARAGELAGQFQYRRPPSSPRWPWFVVGGVTVLPLIVLLVSATVNESSKIDKLVTIADGMAPAGWKLTGGYNPDHDITCIPFDQSCHHLSRTWETPEPVSLQELVDSSGYELEIGTVYRPDCANGYDGRVRIRLCADGRRVDLDMND